MSAEQATYLLGPEAGAAVFATEHRRSIASGTLIAISVVLIIVAILMIHHAKSSDWKAVGWLFVVLALGGLGFGGRMAAVAMRRKRA